MKGLIELANISEFKKNHRLGQTGVVFDFDGTITQTTDYYSHWDALTVFAPSKAQQKIKKIREKYINDFHNQTLPQNLQFQWIYDQLKIYKQYDIDEDFFYQAAKLLTPRDDVWRIINSFSRVAIISFGITNIIKFFFDIHGKNNIRIFANDYNELNKLNAFNAVIPATKHIYLQKFCCENDLQLKNLLVIGDSTGDFGMFLPETFNVFIQNNSHPRQPAAIPNLDLKITSYSQLFNILCS